MMLQIKLWIAKNKLKRKYKHKYDKVIDELVSTALSKVEKGDKRTLSLIIKYLPQAVERKLYHEQRI